MMLDNIFNIGNIYVYGIFNRSNQVKRLYFRLGKYFTLLSKLIEESYQPKGAELLEISTSQKSIEIIKYR